MKLLTLRCLILALLLSTIPALATHHSHTTQKIANDKPLPLLDSLTDNKPLDLKIPHMERFVEQGVPTIFTQIDELPILDISITFKGGSAKDDTIRPDGYGIANMTATMMTQGTHNLDENEFAEHAELLGARFGASTSRDAFHFTFRSLSDDKELLPALDLFTDMIKNPRFDENILKRNLAQADLGFERDKQNPSRLAHLAFLKTLYGTHPYAMPTSGIQSSVATIHREDLIAYKNKYLTQDNAHIAITGDISISQAKTIAHRLVSALPKGEKVPNLPTPIPPKPQHIHLPYDSTQTHIYIGHLGDKHTTDPTELQNHTNFSLGNAILAGGDFNAHLMTEIRKKGGYTYGIRGGMTTFDERGYYRISFSTQTDKATKAIEETLQVIKNTRKNGITDRELNLERTRRKYAYPMMLDTNSAIHNTALTLNYNNLPDSHITDYLVRLDNATLSDVNHALNTYIRPDEFIIITIGKQKPDLSHLFDKNKTIKHKNKTY